VATNVQRVPQQPGQAVRWFDPRGRQLGMWAYSLNRLSGILLTIYIFFHFANISALWLGPAAWNQLMDVFRTWPFLIFDVGLLLLLIYHGLNGIRLAVLALDIGTTQQKSIFWGLMAVGAIGLIFAAIGIFATG
jgi:succinate dehydrogenase / fumarate reductase cytochrome b subunit